MALRSMTAFACVAATLLTSAPAVSAPMGFQPAQIEVKNEQLIQVHRKKRYHRNRHKRLVRHRHDRRYARHRRHHRHHRHHHTDALIVLGIVGLGLAVAAGR